MQYPTRAEPQIGAGQRNPTFIIASDYAFANPTYDYSDIVFFAFLCDPCVFAAIAFLLASIPSQESAFIPY
jgi:hypothetical protein